MQCIIMENTLIKLTLHDETKKRAHDSQIVRAKENLKYHAVQFVMEMGILLYFLNFTRIELNLMFKMASSIVFLE